MEAGRPDTVPVTYKATGEVRFAVVLYGGVSLAIYMNGIVQELFALVRATAPARDVADDGTRPLHLSELHGAEAIYRELACRLDGKRLIADEGVVKTRFVVDILTGTSAGGINGVFLAKALANDQLIDQLTNLWIQEGDIKNLLNDKQAYRDLGNLAHERPPESLLSGGFMLFKLLQALDVMSSDRADAELSPYADQIDLWVTATDLNGRPERVALSDQARLGKEREVDHHTRLHFVYDAGGVDKPINMFGREFDPLLALAARATSSFPGAFRPVQPRDLIAVEKAYLETHRPAERQRPWHDLDDADSQRLFQRYGEPQFYKTVSFADGGYLDNQPVDLVMETLPKRSADLPVRRRVLLIDPDPGAEPPEHVTIDAERADLLSTLLKVVTLPRVETIGTEVDRIEALAGPLKTRRTIYDAVDAALEAGQTDTLGSATYSGYLALRVSNTLDDIAEAIARIGFSVRAYDPDSPEFRLSQEVVRRWYDGAKPANFLRDLDLAFAMRRINYVKHRLDPVRSSEMTELDYINQQLIRDGRSLRSRVNPTPDVENLRVALDAYKKVSAGEDSSPADRDAACSQAASLLPPILSPFVKRLALETEREAASVVIRGLADPKLTLAWEHFESFDDATLALRQLIPGENDDIRVVRVSPADADALYFQEPGKPKLAGTAVHHFGGFFDADWRRNDIMWGRLDACERLIAVLLEDADDPGAVAEFTRCAQLAIIGDLLQDPEYVRLFKIVAPGCDAPATSGGHVLEVPPAENVLANLAHFVPPPGPTREEVLALATRASKVSDALVGGLAAQSGQLQPIRKSLSAVLRPVSQLGELVLDRSVKSALTRHLLDIAIFAAIVMIVVGPLLGGGGVAGFGWTVLAVAVGIKLIVNVGRDWVRGKRWWWMTLLVPGVAATLVGLEGMQFAMDPTRWIGLFLLGAASGFLLAARKPAGVGSQKPAVAIGLAVVIVLGVAVVGMRELASHPIAKLCHQSKWEHDVVEWLPAVDCPAAPAPAASG